MPLAFGELSFLYSTHRIQKHGQREWEIRQTRRQLNSFHARSSAYAANIWKVKWTVQMPSIHGDSQALFVWPIMIISMLYERRYDMRTHWYTYSELCVRLSRQRITYYSCAGDAEARLCGFMADVIAELAIHVAIAPHSDNSANDVNCVKMPNNAEMLNDRHRPNSEKSFRSQL